MYFEGMVSPCQISVLPEDAIAEGAHVLLDVRGCKLRLAKAMHDPFALAAVEIAEYELRDIDAALLMFDYLQRHGERFASVKIV
jgi:hypothetical protein